MITVTVTDEIGKVLAERHPVNISWGGGRYP